MIGAATMLVAGAATLPSVATAQQGADDVRGLEEIVVTARKRQESLIEVPVAVSVMTGKDIEQRGVQSLNDVALFTPGLWYFDSIQNTLGTPVIRGVSQTNLNSPDRNVAVFYGGVYMANLSATNVEMLDLARVEVVKGPQSALYGQNAFNGAINYVPAEPTEAFDASVGATIGNHGRKLGRFMVSGPIGETVSGRLAASYDTFDGSWDNSAVAGESLGGYRTKTVSAKVNFNPSDAFNASFFGYHTDDWRGPGAAYYGGAQNCGPTGRPLSGYCGDFLPKDTLAANVVADVMRRKVTLAALDLSYDFGPVTIKSKTGRYEADLHILTDYDLGANNGTGAPYPIISRAAVNACIASGKPATTCFFSPVLVPTLRTQNVPLLVGSGGGYTRTTTQELRLEGDQENALKWSIGAYYSKNDYNSTSGAAFDARGLAAGEIPRDGLGFALSPANVNYTDPTIIPYASNAVRNDKTTAYFGSIEYAMTDSLKFGAELRHDKQDRKQVDVITAPTLFRSETEKFNTWRFHVDYALAPDQRFYMSAAKGVISGYFNPVVDATIGQPVPVELQTYAPAENKTYEIGWKAEWLDRTVATEVSVYNIDYSGIQISTAPPPPLVSNLIQNIGSATSRGVEIAVNWAVTQELKVGGTYSYSPTEYDKNTPGGDVLRYCGNNTGGVYYPTLCTNWIQVNGKWFPDVAGNQLPRSPNRLASMYVSFDKELSADMSFYGRTDVSYTSETPTLSSPLFGHIPSRTIVNARLGVRRGPLDVALWARNLFDKKYVSAVIYQPTFNTVQYLSNVSQGERATYGLTATYSFGDKR